jgi:hypothetical protein
MMSKLEAELYVFTFFGVLGFLSHFEKKENRTSIQYRPQATQSHSILLGVLLDVC